MKRLHIFSILFLFFFFCSPAGAKTIQGRLVGVSDGDTIKVVSDGKQIKIRLYGIDTPEKKQAFGQAAKKQISSLLTSQVSIEEKDKDRWGRTVGIIYTSAGINVNEEMVKTGSAWVYRTSGGILTESYGYEFNSNIITMLIPLVFQKKNFNHAKLLKVIWLILCVFIITNFKTVGFRSNAPAGP